MDTPPEGAAGAPFASLAPLAGGYSGETFLAVSGGERTVVRVYAGSGARRGPDAPEVDAAVLHLVRGLLPVPEVLEVRRGDVAGDVPGLLVTSFVAGERLDVLLPTLDEEGLATVGSACGDLAGRLACMPMPRTGLLALVDRGLADRGLGDRGPAGQGPAGPAGLVVEPMPARWLDLAAYAADQLPVLGLGPDDAARLIALARRAQDRLDGVTRACLVHSDLNPKNLLVDPTTLEVTAVLDWEFAHAGTPFTDVGNLLRFEQQPAFREAVLSGYRARVPDAPDDLEEAATAADLWGLLELAGRREEHRVGRAAHDLLRARVAR